MKVYGSSAIRNVAFVGHGGSGKTTLVDALAFVSGSSRRHGSIKDGTTLTDNSPDEIERKHSISLGLAYAEWMDTKINLLDTPGYLDFFGEVVTRRARRRRRGRGPRAAPAGVEVGTEKAWELLRPAPPPAMLFVSGWTRSTPTSSGSTSDEDAPHAQCDPGRDSVGDGRDFHGIVNLFSGHCHMYRKGTKTGEYERASARRSTRPASTVHRAVHRNDRLDRRYADRALPGWRGDPPRRVVAAVKAA